MYNRIEKINFVIIMKKTVRIGKQIKNFNRMNNDDKKIGTCKYPLAASF